MKKYNLRHKDGTIATRVVCAVCFLLFCFCWIYHFQADVLAVAQHVLSEGVTSYDRTIGAVIITLVLWLLQMVVAAIVRLKRRTHALTYLPSMLLLVVLSDIHSDIDLHHSQWIWAWLAPLILLLWGALVWLARQVLPFSNDEKEPTGLFSRRVWLNLLQMAVMMLMVAWAGNTNAVFHYSAHAEASLMKGDVDEALRVGAQSLETDRRLTMLRVYALSKKGLLGQQLFCYPIAGSSQDMLPMTLRPQMLSADSIWRHLGACPSAATDAETYYKALERDSLATSAVADYRLCGLLIDRNLDAFVRLLPRYYAVADSLPLPRHYQEALVLYRHLHTRPVIVYRDAVTDANWEALRGVEAQYTTESERRYHVYDTFRDTYWYYYSYCR